LNTELKPGLWGISTSVDLYECNFDKMNDPVFIRETVVELCELIDMVRFGECQVVFFGEGDKAGYTMFQLIETSNITAHFANEGLAIYFDIFSCKGYDPEIVQNFLMNKFDAKRYMTTVTERFK
jgi:S-adenosylmethionine/arginine decarboxylase-like enzyme